MSRHLAHSRWNHYLCALNRYCFWLHSAEDRLGFACKVDWTINDRLQLKMMLLQELRLDRW